MCVCVLAIVIVAISFSHSRAQHSSPTVQHFSLFYIRVIVCVAHIQIYYIDVTAAAAAALCFMFSLLLRALVLVQLFVDVVDRAMVQDMMRLMFSCFVYVLFLDVVWYAYSQTDRAIE